MNLVYRFVKPFVTFSTRRFFSAVVVAGAEAVEEGPLLIVANHPNVMLDALLVINTYHRVLWFLVKSTVFRGPVTSQLLSALHLVPIFRAVDNPDDTSKNKDTFREVSAKLRDSQAVLIFPEGQSMAERKLLPIKTGAARIAFQAEEESGFDLNLKIQAAGITYSDLFRYNSSVTVVLDKPIDVRDYREAFKLDPRQAVRDLSQSIEASLKRVTAEVQSRPHTELVVNIAKLYRSKGLGRNDQNRIQTVSKNVERYLPSHPSEGAKLGRRIELYLHLASSLRLDGSEALEGSLDPIFLVPAAPFIAFGTMIHLIPFRLAARYGAKAAPHVSQLSSWRFALGTLFFLCWYALLALLFYHWFASARGALLFLLTILGSGYLAHKEFNKLSLFIFGVLWPGRHSPVEVLRNMRDDLIAELEAMRTGGADVGA